jgi:transcriptional regulator with XRE-family HTH domain
MGKPLLDKEKTIEKLRANFKTLYIELERELGINRKIIAQESGVDPSIISKMINASSPNLSWFSLYSVAKLFGVTMDSIIEGTYDIKKIKSHLINTLKIAKK